MTKSKSKERPGRAIPIHEAKAKLSSLIQRAEAGERIVIARGKEPVVRLVPIDQPVGRRFGAMKGKARVDDAFFEPLPDDELEAWNT